MLGLGRALLAEKKYAEAKTPLEAAAALYPTYGEAAMSGTPKALAPVRTASGLVVRATSAINDLIAITPPGLMLAKSAILARPAVL